MGPLTPAAANTGERVTKQGRIEGVGLCVRIGLVAAAVTVTLFAVSCGGGSADVAAVTPVTPVTPVVPIVTPPVVSSTLLVVSGITAATTTPGATYDVFATADPVGKVFDKWVGDTVYLQTPGERRSGTLPLTGVTGTKTITATYKTLPAFVPLTKVLNGTGTLAVNAYWYFPQALPKGVIFRFHGAGGTGGAQFQKVEEVKFVRDAVGDGYAVVSLDSQDRVNKSWDGTTDPSNPASNLDVANVQGLISGFKTQGLMGAATPVFGSGHSAGAGAALRMAYLLGWKASHQHDVPGATGIAQTTTVAGIWTMSKNDIRADLNRNSDALVNSNYLAARGVPTQYILMATSAVYPTRFAQVPGLNEADSTTIYNALRAAGTLDANNYQVKDPFDVNFNPLIPPAYSAYNNDIIDQLNVAYAAHQFQAATNRRVLDFFNARLP